MSTTSIKDHWRGQKFRDTRSYTHMPYPKFVSEAGQNWFRDCTIAVLRRRTRESHPFRRVVDLGCSVGDWTLKYLEFADRVTGVDINDSFIAEANRRAAEVGLADRAQFLVGDIASWTDFTDAGLVTIGAVLTCLDATENAQLVGAISDAQRTGDWLYVRATVLNPGREPFVTAGGNYRHKQFYRDLFAGHGYSEVFEAYSTSLATSGAIVRAGAAHRAARAATLGLNAGIMGARFVRRDLDYCNWLLRRA